MSNNPFKINEKVADDFEVEKATTKIVGFNENDFSWNLHDEAYYEFLTLNEILEQALKKSNETVPFLRVEYESGLWGVIFEVGNYPELGKQWIVHGITKGYA